MTAHTIFLTRAGSPAENASARLLIDSLRTFGGEMSTCPIWVFVPAAQAGSCQELASQQVRVIPLDIPATLGAYPFGHKVCACASAEQMAPPDAHSLIWCDLQCLVVQPPLLFDLGSKYDAAVRPVHIRNVGLSSSEPLDAFWQGVYAAVGVDDVTVMVTSFVDSQRLRAYFNTHFFAIRPGLGLMARWYELFQGLVGDQSFQRVACPDERHRIFLFQALLSALLASSIEPRRLRLLPPAYNYPYNLHDRVPPDRRPSALNELVCLTFEGREVHPAAVTDIQLYEPLRSWLEEETQRH
jgi:hypothetical protein